MVYQSDAIKGTNERNSERTNIKMIIRYIEVPNDQFKYKEPSKRDS